MADRARQNHLARIPHNASHHHRPLTDIAPEELINAMADTANAGRYDDEHELYRATMLVFGQRRLTSQTIARLAVCRQLAEERSRLIRIERGDWRGGA